MKTDQEKADDYDRLSYEYTQLNQDYKSVKRKLKEQLRITVVSGMFSADQMEQAYINGQENEEQRCGHFNIENYR